MELQKEYRQLRSELSATSDELAKREEELNMQSRRYIPSQVREHDSRRHEGSQFARRRLESAFTPTTTTPKE